MKRWEVTFLDVKEVRVVVEMPDEFSDFDAECVAEAHLLGRWPHSDDMPEHEIIDEYETGIQYFMDDADVVEVEIQ